MRNLLLPSLAALSILYVPVAKSDTCSASDLSPRIQYFIDVLGKESKSRPSWFNHKLGEYPIFFIDAKASGQCAAFWQPGKGVSTFQLSEAYLEPAPHRYLPIYNPNYKDINYGNFQNQADLRQLQRVLVNANEKQALLWVWGSYEPDLSNSMAQEYNKKGTGQLASGVRTAIHEAFHYFVQDSEKVWTRFGSTKFRDEDLFKCYIGSPQAKDIHRKEVDALLAAFTASDRATKISQIKEFISLRRKRNSLIPAVAAKDPSGNEFSGSCAENEARQELGEGVPQFVGNALLLDLELGTRGQIAYEVSMVTNYYLDQDVASDQRPIQSYYHTGSLSLLLIRDLYKGNFLELTERISRPDAQFVVTDFLESLVSDVKP